MLHNKVKAWNISGSYFEICSCNVTCPCNFLSKPSEGFCNVAFAFDIQNGSHGDVDLKGLRVVLVVESPDHMMEGNWTAGVYIDERADEEQRKALTGIFSGTVGGHMEKLVKFVTKFAGVKFVPINIEENVDKRTVEIPGILSSTIQAIKGNDGGHVVLENMPLTFWLPERVKAAKQEKFSFKDPDMGFVWEWEGKHGAYSRFDWAGQ